MGKFAVIAVSVAICVVTIAAALFLKDYRGAQAERALRLDMQQVAEDNHQRWQDALASTNASCESEIESAVQHAREEAALEAVEQAIDVIEVDAEGECGLDSSIRW